ncbi:MAG: DNA polymerase III subunit gamma/tau [Bacteroidia bacterium]
MNQFVVSARKYRPATFDTVVGQSHITNTLKNAIKSNHLAQAFLFCGPRGVGKTTCARILAKTINCENITANTEACDKCESCISFNNNASLNIYELDAASNNSVEDIRGLVEQVRYAPQYGKFKIYIIDEVHMLSASAFNAFLKTLEEPPSYAIFILATTEKHKIIPTILSRCQIFDFNRIRIEDIAKHLEGIAISEKVIAEPDGLHIIAQKADGAMRDALSMFDQIVSFAGSTVTYKDVINNLNVLDYDYYFKITEFINAADYRQLLLTFDELLNDGFDAHHFINGLSSHFRDLLVCKDAVTLPLLEVSPNIREKYKQQATQVETEFLLAFIEVCNKCDIEYKAAKNQRLHVELALLKMCRLKKNSNSDVSFIGDIAAPANLEFISKAASVSEVSSAVKPIASAKDVKAETVEEPRAAYKKTEPAPTPTSATQEKKPASTNGSPTLTPSLKNFGRGKSKDTEKETPAFEPVEKNIFTIDELYNAIESFAAKMLKENKRNLNYTLVTHKPQLKENFEVAFTVDNKTQEEEIQNIKADLFAHLKSILKNDFIRITTKVEAALGEKNAYTAKEKFEAMAEKNPALNELKKRFDLEF